MLNAFATWYHRFRRYFDLIDAFVVTNGFMHRMMVEAGFPERRLRIIPTFVNGSIFRPCVEMSERRNIVYVGRLEHIKGVHVLIDAIAQLKKRRPELPLSLRIAGAGDEQYVASLKEQLDRNGLRESVQFVGDLGAEEVSSLFNSARFSVVPALWYENLPNALLESLACGTPVLASGMGSLSAVVMDGETGFLFRAGDPTDLAEHMEHCFDHPEHVTEMSRRARRVSVDQYSCQTHMETLENLFDELVSARSQSAYA
jgi:glycosyltransferase involved in cell wall biosynthesis